MSNNIYKILVVDDEEKIVEVVKAYLEHSGYEVYTAYNGKQALETFARVSPALVVLDLMLPDMSGEEICQILRKESIVPIVMLTAKVDEENISRGLALGANDYITKPFNLRQFVTRLATLLRRPMDDAMPISDNIA